jgi:acyl-coenzyme A thioesterase PaaI-like protein
VSEAAPGTGDDAGFATPARAELAQALRDLIEATMTTGAASESDLGAAAESVRAATTALVGPDAVGSDRPGGAGYTPRTHDDYLPRSPVVGEASPLSPRLDWDIVDGRCHGRGTFTAQFEGPPGYVHGGIVALAFDEVLGIVNIANGSPGMTGTLSIRYRRPTPLYREVTFEAWVERVEGRRIQSRAELRVDGAVCAEAEGLFVQPRPELAAEYFGAGAPGATSDAPSPA